MGGRALTFEPEKSLVRFFPLDDTLFRFHGEQKRDPAISDGNAVPEQRKRSILCKRRVGTGLPGPPSRLEIIFAGFFLKNREIFAREKL